MTATYYKATRPDGTDFHTGTIDYAAAVGRSVRARSPKATSYECCTDGVLHASDVPTETLIGGGWPCRLFAVTGKPVAQLGHKYGFRRLTVVREVDAHLALGPQGREVAALVERAGALTADDVERLHAARDAARDAAWEAERDAAWDAAREAARGAARGAARDAAWEAERDAAWPAAREAARGAAWALVVRDLIGSHGYTQAHYDNLTRPWREVVGSVHPDDPGVVVVTP